MFDHWVFKTIFIFSLIIGSTLVLLATVGYFDGNNRTGTDEVLKSRFENNVSVPCNGKWC